MKDSFMARATLIVMAVLMLLAFSVAGAPTVTGELIMMAHGDLWAWTPDGGDPVQLTTWGYNQQAMLSPDGTRVAYNSWAQLTVTALNDPNQFFLGDPPSNIWLLDIASREFRRIADQPGNATLQANSIIRSNPVWSPDSARLAWIETRPAGQTSFVAYDFDTETTVILAQNLDLGFQDAGLRVPQIQWGDGGISRHFITHMEDGNFHSIIEIYDPANGQVDVHDVGNSGNSTLLLTHVWLSHQSQSRIAFVTEEGLWSLFDPTSGATTPLGAPPTLQIMDAPADALTLTPLFEPAVGGWTWQVNHSNGTSASLGHTSRGITEISRSLSISPDGQSIAYIDNGIFIWEDGQATQIHDIPDEFEPGRGSNLAWTQLIWTTGDGGPPDSVGNCQPAPRLVIGDIATVLPGPANNLRRAADTSSRVLALIPPGDTFRVLDGPICADGFNWWQVEYDGVTGWTAEGQGNTYWLAPSG